MITSSKSDTEFFFLHLFRRTCNKIINLLKKKKRLFFLCVRFMLFLVASSISIIRFCSFFGVTARQLQFYVLKKADALFGIICVRVAQWLCVIFSLVGCSFTLLLPFHNFFFALVHSYYLTKCSVYAHAHSILWYFQALKSLLTNEIIKFFANSAKNAFYIVCVTFYFILLLIFKVFFWFTFLLFFDFIVLRLKPNNKEFYSSNIARGANF